MFTMLRRIGVGPYPADQMVTAEQLQQMAEEGGDDKSALDALLLPMDTAAQGLEAVEVSAKGQKAFQHGNPHKPDSQLTGLVRVYGPEGLFLGVGEMMLDGELAPRKVVNYVEV